MMIAKCFTMIFHNFNYFHETMNINSTSSNPTNFNYYNIYLYYYYINPVVASFSTALNLLNTIILGSRDIRKCDRVYQYFSFNSANFTLLSFFYIFIFLNKCTNFSCSISTSYWSQIYLIFVATYILTSLNNVCSTVQIALQIDVYLTLTRKPNWLGNYSPYKICFFIFGN